VSGRFEDGAKEADPKRLADILLGL
jgi:hypothetical protein